MIFFSVLIPNFNGIELLKQNLPTVIKRIGDWKEKTEILVVDDGSTDKSTEFLKNNFPEVRVVSLHKNQGFAMACNAGFIKAQGEIVILLNNDVEVVSDIFSRLIEYFKDEKLFAVTFCMLDRKTGTYTSTPTLPKMKYGLIVPDSINPAEAQVPCPTFLAHGGGSAFRRSYFIALKGFDPLYSPFYFEDVDLSYRAWSSGFRIYYDRECILLHSPKSTIGKKYDISTIETLHRKNKIIFFWKNISQHSLIAIHLLYIPLILLGALFLGKFTIYKSYFLALKQLSQIIEVRRQMGKKLYSDKEILNIFRTKS